MQISLTVLTGDRSGRELFIGEKELVIGRDPGCQFAIAHNMVSPQHCRIVRESDRVLLEDLDSANGTELNEQFIHIAELKDGDKLKVGPISFRAHIVGDPGESERRISRADTKHDPNSDSPAVATAKQILGRLTRKEDDEPARPRERERDLDDLAVVRPRLKVEERDDGVALVELVDRSIIDEAHINKIADELDELIDSGARRIVLDFGNVKHLASQAVGAMVRVNRKAQAQGGMVKVCNPGPAVFEIFQITNLRRIMEIHPDTDLAVQSPWPEAAPITVEKAAATKTVAPSRASSAAPIEKEKAKDRDREKAAPVVKVRLVIEVGKAKGQTIAVPAPRFVIGRDPRCHLRPNSAAVSRTHTMIEQREGKVFVRDLGATNGTQVAGRTLHKEECEAHDGDKLQIGPLVFTFSINRRDTGSTTDPDDLLSAWLQDGPPADSDAATAIIQAMPPSPPPTDARSSIRTLKPVTEASVEAGGSPTATPIPPDIRHMTCTLFGDAVLAMVLVPVLNDESEIGPLRHELQLLVDQPLPRWHVVSLEKVTSISRGGVGIFLAHAQRLSKVGGRLRLCNVANDVAKVLEQGRLSAVADIFPTADAALAALWHD